MAEKKKEKSKDPWHPDNIEETLEQRIGQKDVVSQTLQTHAAYIHTQIVDLLPKDKKGVAIYDALNKRSKAYDAKVDEKVKALIPKLLDPNDAKYSPLKGRLKDLDAQERDLVASLYFPSAQTVKTILERDDWVRQLDAVLENKRQEVAREMSGRLLYGFDRETHGENAVKFLTKKLGLTTDDQGYLDKERLKAEVEGVIAQYARADNFSKRDLLNAYGSKKPEKKKK